MSEMRAERAEQDWEVDPEYMGTGEAFRRRLDALRSVHEGLTEQAAELDIAGVGGPSPSLRRQMGEVGIERFRVVLDEIFSGDEDQDRFDLLEKMYTAVEGEPWGVRVYLEFAEMAHRHLRAPVFHASMLTSAYGAFEAHLEMLARDFYHSAPKALNVGQRDDVKEFSLQDIQKLGSIEATIEFAIEARVTKLSFGGLEDWVSFFKNKANIDLSQVYGWADVLEIHERRNCVVHHSGVASARYEKFTQGKVPKGTYLEIDAVYVEKAFASIEIVGTLILIELWRKFCGDVSAPEYFLDRQGYRALSTGNWAVALPLYHNAEKNALDAASRLTAQVNIWLSEKNLRGTAAIEDAVRSWDLSASSELYKLARAALLDDLDGCFLLIDSLLKEGLISGEQLATWPLLAHVRLDPRIEGYREEIRHYVDEQSRDDGDQEAELLSSAPNVESNFPGNKVTDSTGPTSGSFDERPEEIARDLKAEDKK